MELDHSAVLRVQVTMLVERTGPTPVARGGVTLPPAIIINKTGTLIRILIVITVQDRIVVGVYSSVGFSFKDLSFSTGPSIGLQQKLVDYPTVGKVVTNKVSEVRIGTIVVFELD